MAFLPIVSPQSFTPFPHGFLHTCIPYILLTPFSPLDCCELPPLTGLTSLLCIQCRRRVSPTVDRSYTVKTGAIPRDVTMHRNTTMRVKGWKGRHSDHTCSESDCRVSVLSVYLSGYPPPKGLSCFDVLRKNVVALWSGQYLDIVSSAYLTEMGFMRFITYILYGYM